MVLIEIYWKCVPGSLRQLDDCSHIFIERDFGWERTMYCVLLPRTEREPRRACYREEGILRKVRTTVIDISN